MPPRTHSPHHSFHTVAFTALVLGACGIGFAPIFVRMSPVGPAATAFWRVFLACPILGTVWFMQRGQGHAAPLTGPRAWLMLFLPGFCFAGDMVCWHWSIAYTSVANATLLTNLAPVVVTAFTWIVLRHHVSGVFIVGLGATLLGAGLLMGDSLSISPGNFRGDVMGAVSAVWYAAYQITGKSARARFSAPAVITLAAAASAFTLLIVCFVTGEPLLWTEAPQVRGWAVLLGLAVVSHVCGQGLIIYALAHLPGPFASTSLLVQPLVAALAGWLILSEAIGPLQGLGGAAILFGIFIAQRGAFTAKRTDECPRK